MDIQIIVFIILLLPIALRILFLHLYPDERDPKNSDFLVTIFDAFSELLNGKHKK